MTGTVSCVMDARAGQVYNARFRLNGVGAPERLTPDRALTIQALGEEIGQDGEILVGDGAYLCYTKLTEICPHLVLAPTHLIYPGAYGVAMAALQASATERQSTRKGSTQSTCASRRPNRCGIEN